MNGEIANGEMVNSPAFGDDVSNGDMRPARAPGMPKIKRVKNHAPGSFHYQTISTSIFSSK